MCLRFAALCILCLTTISCGLKNSNIEIFESANSTAKLNQFSNGAELLTQASNGTILTRGTYNYTYTNRLNDLSTFRMNGMIITNTPAFAERYLAGSFELENIKDNPNDALPATDIIKISDSYTDPTSGETHYYFHWNHDGNVSYGNAIMDEGIGEYSGNSLFYVEGSTLLNTPNETIVFSGPMVFNKMSTAYWKQESGTFNMTVNIDHATGAFRGKSENELFEAYAYNIQYDAARNLLTSQTAGIGQAEVGIKNAEMVGSLFGEDGTLVGGFIYSDLEDDEHYIAQFAGEQSN